MCNSIGCENKGIWGVSNPPPDDIMGQTNYGSGMPGLSDSPGGLHQSDDRDGGSRQGRPGNNGTEGLISISRPLGKTRGILPSTFDKFHSGIDNSGRVIFGWLNNKVQLQAQHIRSTGNEPHDKKKMPWIGDPEDLLLFGQHLWNGKRYLVIVVGEFDALSAHEAGFAVGCAQNDSVLVSAVSRNIQAIHSARFEKIIIAIEKDKSGLKAREEIAKYLHSESLPVCLLDLPGEEDLNDVLQKQGVDGLKKLLWNTTVYLSPFISRVSEIRERILAGDAEPIEPILLSAFKKACPFFLPANVMIVAAGTGMGKTSLMQKMCLDATIPRLWVGLEETVDEYLLNFLSLRDKTDYSHVSRERSRDIKDWEIPGLFLANANSIKNTGGFLQSIKSGIKETSAKVVFIDHITYLSYLLGNDINLIDAAMVGLHEIAKTENVQLVIGSQLNQDKLDDPHNIKFSMSRIRGSGSISQVASVVVGLSAPSKDANFRFIDFAKNRPFRDHSQLKLTLSELKGE
jgi:DnaB-like helicase C terminal domain/Toprim domain